MAGVFRENDRKSSERIDNSGRFESSSRRSARTSDPVRAPLQAAMRLALRRPRASATRPHTARANTAIEMRIHLSLETATVARRRGCAVTHDP